MSLANTIITITGPSCAGKSTLEALLVKKGMGRILSTTTRPIRRGESNGREYRFISKSEFSRLEAQGAFVETVQFNNNSYGVLCSDAHSAIAKNGVAVVVVEPNGKMQFEKFAAKNNISLIRIFVNNPQEVILKRFLTRFGDDYISSLEASVDTYASRLQEMMTVEKDWSSQEALKGYDLVLSEFAETTTVPALQSIMRLIKTDEKSLSAA